MTQIKVFDYAKVNDLEENVNEFLKSMGKNASFQLIDIKYNTYTYGEDRLDYHSAMIIYYV